ncbi:MAG: hypothetical protein HY521_13200 [Proteobacteria bacterium]|nr:hypothetical protein [Pseudomonadota bacterium]
MSTDDPVETLEAMIAQFRQVGAEIEEMANQSLDGAADRLLEGARVIFAYADRMEARLGGEPGTR